MTSISRSWRELDRRGEPYWMSIKEDDETGRMLISEEKVRYHSYPNEPPYIWRPDKVNNLKELAEEMYTLINSYKTDDLATDLVIEDDLAVFKAANASNFDHLKEENWVEMKCTIAHLEYFMPTCVARSILEELVDRLADEIFIKEVE